MLTDAVTIIAQPSITEASEVSKMLECNVTIWLIIGQSFIDHCILPTSQLHCQTSNLYNVELLLIIIMIYFNAVLSQNMSNSDCTEQVPSFAFIIIFEVL